MALRQSGGSGVTEPVLSVDKLSKAFGAIRAVDQVSFTLDKGELHALIGPNGAGKSTLLAMISGLLPADQGSVRLSGENISNLSMAQRARRGIGRSFQVTSVFDDFTALENVALAVQAQLGGHGQFWRKAESNDHYQNMAKSILDRVGIAHTTKTVARGLAHGDKRLLELAIAIATKPLLLLLDEPMAGVGADKRRQISHLIRQLGNDLPILFVEHDMDVVFGIADRVSVLSQGRLIASGTPPQIRDSAEIKQLYLGETA